MNARLWLVSLILKYVVVSYFDYQICFLLNNLSIKLLIRAMLFEQPFSVTTCWATTLYIEI